ncbi:MAG: FG-GAP repeat protein [Candidatus Eisenbacteria bacterium]|nr:FG-GAP repeat protein [Candidatus Eisenbacteria bacterium]
MRPSPRRSALAAKAREGFTHRRSLAVTAALITTCLAATSHVHAAPLISTIPFDTIEGDQSGALFGEHAITAGDVNGDGLSDVIVGARLYNNGEAVEGRVIVFFADATGLPTTPSWFRESDEIGAALGTGVACLGDATGDGFDDIAAGAPNYGSDDDGVVFVYKGSATGPPNGANRTLLGPQAGCEFGAAVAGAGDVNNDGFRDLLIGAPGWTNGQAAEGAAFIVLGAAGGVETDTSWQVESNVAGARFGSVVSGAGDVNGDGFDDVLVGSARFSNGQSSEGKAFLYLGSASGLATTPAWQFESDQASANLGVALSAAGDVNCDGYADFLVGASRFDNGNTDEGRAYLFFGSPTPISTTPARTYEVNEDGASFGTALGTAGDVNGDGYADFAIGGTGIDAGGVSRGRVLLYLGGIGSAPTSPSFTFSGTQDQSGFGGAVAAAGDLNGDGFSELLIAAEQFDTGIANAGSVFFFRGAAGPPSLNAAWGEFGPQNGSQFGASLDVIGDVNADGFDDLLVGAPKAVQSGRRDGQVFLYRGSETGLSVAANATFQSPVTTDAGFGYGDRVSAAGDVNADGFDDFLIADYNDESGGFGGRVQLWFGASGAPTQQKAFRGDPDELLGGQIDHGDFDGDGFSDVVIAGPGWSDVNVPEAGRVRVFNGGVSGPDDFADWELQGKTTARNVGRAGACAGDVNGDGFDDLLVSSFSAAPTPTAGEVNLFLGTACGPASEPAWTVIGAFSNQDLGSTLGACGDVNGDGFSDVAIYSGRKAPAAAEGKCEIYLGNSTGLELTPSLVLEGITGASDLGRAIHTAGDLNNDGFSDLLLGAPALSEPNGAEARIYLGGPAGLAATPVWTTFGGSADDLYGSTVSGGGDFNADGYSDVAVGALLGEEGEFSFPGFVSVYHGNDGRSVDLLLMQQQNAAGVVRIATGARNPLVNDLVRVQLLLRNASGRARVRPQVERRFVGEPFVGPTHATGSFVDTGSPVSGEGSAALVQRTFSGFTAGSTIHWRTRAKSTNPLFPYSPWLCPQGNAPHEADVRMLPITVGVEETDATALLFLAPPAPNPTRSSLSIEFALRSAGKAELALYDAQGRQVRRLISEQLAAGRHQAHWDGRDSVGRPVASGVYFARLSADGGSAARKVIVQR